MLLTLWKLLTLFCSITVSPETFLNWHGPLFLGRLYIKQVTIKFKQVLVGMEGMKSASLLLFYQQQTKSTIFYFILEMWCVLIISRIQLTHRRHVEAQGGTPPYTRSDFRSDHLEKLRLSIVQHVELRDVVILLVFWMFWVTVYPQATTVCQWLLRTWWEWDLQDCVQDKPSVSWILPCWYIDEQIHIPV